MKKYKCYFALYCSLSYCKIFWIWSQDISKQKLIKCKCSVFFDLLHPTIYISQANLGRYYDLIQEKNKLLEKTTNKKDWCCKSWKSLDGYETAGNLNWLVLNRIEVRLDSAETSAASSYYFLKFMLFLWLFKLQCLNSFPFITPGAGRHFVLLFCDFWNFNT